MTGGSTEPESPHDQQCPKCGLYYSGKGNAMNMHTVNCDGEDGVSGDTETSEGNTSDNGPEAASDGSSGSQSTETASSNPLHDGPELEQGSSVGENGDDSTDTCPECGSELYDFRNKETWTDPQGRMHDTPDDYYCLDGCGKGWNK